jgi:hypothetical protein
MKVLKCGGCGAPFDEVPEDTAVQCAFCGAVNEPTIMQRPSRPSSGDFPAVQIVIDRSSIPRAARTAGKIGAAAALFSTFITLLVIAIGAGGVWYGLRQAAPHQVPRLPFETRWTLSNLADLHDRGRRAIDVAAPPGGFARFDPVAQLPWATTVARAWMKDARINRIDADRIRPDGTLDLAGDADAEVMYRFVSPSRIAAYWLDADVNAKAESEHELWVIARGGQPAVQLLRSRPSSGDSAPPVPDALPLASLLERSRRKLPARPLYKGYMIHSKGEGWVWYLSSLSGRDSFPRVRARDGRTWPY